MIVLDTHVLIWWVNGSPALKARARREIRGAVVKGPLHASTISAFEIRSAVRRGRLDLGIPVEQWFADLAALPELRFEPVTAEIAVLAGSFGKDAPGDPADRLIAATALALKAKLITADARLRGFPQLQTVW
ncbi:MAG: type II toxin-antitoxin system VapC family toxin [Pseudomonadota bacterium]